VPKGSKCPYNEIVLAADRLPPHHNNHHIFVRNSIPWSTHGVPDSAFVRFVAGEWPDFFDEGEAVPCAPRHRSLSLRHLGMVFNGYKKMKYLDTDVLEILSYFRSVQQYAKQNRLKDADVRIVIVVFARG
jgi:hypothetical protein